ncbi:MAG: SufD family Fe-S cluster assembly protein, partial [Lachnospiraceae bacterium]|nr:SufD family Fe-S cluster assembly protein [Lachnospiraceae bacterium]
MKTIINKPIAETYGWLHAGGTAVDLPEEPTREVFSLAPGETKTVVRTDADIYVRYEAELPEGASFHFIEIKSADGPEKTHADIHAVCGKDAHFRWTRLLFDGQATYDNCSAELAGEGSSFTADIGYR